MANYLDETGLARVWGKVKGLFTKSNVETALGHTIDKNVPSDAVFTDSNVTQTATDGSSNAEYEILFSGTADNTTRTEGAKKTSRFTFNPQTNQVTAGHFTAESTSPSGTSTATLQGNDVKLGGTSNTWDGTNTSLKTSISGIKQSLSDLSGNRYYRKFVSTNFPTTSLSNGNYFYAIIDTGITTANYDLCSYVVWTNKWQMPMFLKIDTDRLSDTNYILRLYASKTDFPSYNDLSGSPITVLVVCKAKVS